jgi:hypothetical protein
LACLCPPAFSLLLLFDVPLQDLHRTFLALLRLLVLFDLLSLLRQLPLYQ